MKKIYFLILTILMISCERSQLYKYELTIEVHYPTRIDTLKLEGMFNDKPEVSSDRGSNKIYVDDDYVGKTCFESSAPINIIEYKQIQ
jgi:hypothetical protein